MSSDKWLSFTPPTALQPASIWHFFRSGPEPVLWLHSASCRTSTWASHSGTVDHPGPLSLWSVTPGLFQGPGWGRLRGKPPPVQQRLTHQEVEAEENRMNHPGGNTQPLTDVAKTLMAAVYFVQADVLLQPVTDIGTTLHHNCGERHESTV